MPKCESTLASQYMNFILNILFIMLLKLLKRKLLIVKEFKLSIYKDSILV